MTRSDPHAQRLARLQWELVTRKELNQEVEEREVERDKVELVIRTSAANRSIGSITGCTITEKAPTRAFSWLKAPTSAFTFKTLLRHYAKQELTPRSLHNTIIMRDGRL